MSDNDFHFIAASEGDSEGVEAPWKSADGFLRTAAEYLYRSEEQEQEDQGDRPAGQRRQNTDLIPHPFNRKGALALQKVCVHHAACIATLAHAVAGLGIADDPDGKKVAALDAVFPDGGFTANMVKMAMDYFSLGEGYFEVVQMNGKDAYLWLTASEVWKRSYGPGAFDYVYSSVGNVGGAFGSEDSGQGGDGSAVNNVDLEELHWSDFLHPYDSSRAGKVVEGSSEVDGRGVTFLNNPRGSLIRFPQPSNLSEVYGMPGWLSATGYIELLRIHNQAMHDFFFNRATPHVMIFLHGLALNQSQAEQLRSYLQPGAGRGYGSSAVLAFQGATGDTKVQVEKLSDSIMGQSYRELNDSFSTSVCSAHRMMPGLAGISMPKPMGSANDRTQEVLLVEMMVTDPAQRVMESILAQTVGVSHPQLWPQGTKLARMSDNKHLAAMNTMARQRESVAGSDRDPKEGLKRSELLVEQQGGDAFLDDLRKRETAAIERIAKGLAELGAK